MSPQPQSPLALKPAHDPSWQAVADQVLASRRLGRFAMTDDELAEAQTKVCADDRRCWLPTGGAR